MSRVPIGPNGYMRCLCGEEVAVLHQECIAMADPEHLAPYQAVPEPENGSWRSRWG